MREGKLMGFLFPNEQEKEDNSSSVSNERKSGFMPVNNSHTRVSDISLDDITSEEEKFEPTVGRHATRSTNTLDSIVFSPTSYEEAEKIAKELMAGHPAIVNLENMHRNEATRSSAIRIIDYLSGVSFASNVEIQRINNSTFVFKPIRDKQDDTTFNF